jgi:hypothetical protein
MPAINPARLRQQAILLSDQFNDPPAFIRSLHHLLDFYAERVHRPGQAGEPQPLISAYRVRPPVLRQLMVELVPCLTEDPQAALSLCDALWSQDFLEFRLLAAQMLGLVPALPPEPILERVQSWLSQDNDARIEEVVLTQGLLGIREQAPQTLIQLIDAWLSQKIMLWIHLGLRALLPLIKDPNFEDIPRFFQLVQPLCRAIPAPIRPDLVDVLCALARRSPQESAFFLRQIMSMPDNPDTPFLIRQSLPAFPSAIQDSLRDVLRESMKSARNLKYE